MRSRSGPVAPSDGRPFLLGAVYKQVEQSPLDHPPKRDYVNNIDAPRCARLLGLTLQRPRGWPEHALPPTRIFYWLDRDDPARAADYARAAYRKYWLSGESTADPDAAADVAAALGHNRADALAAMQDIAVKQRVIDRRAPWRAEQIRDSRVGGAFNMLNVVSGPGSGMFSRDALVFVSSRVCIMHAR